MTPSAWTAAAILGALGFALFISTFADGPRTARASSFARSVGLDLPPSLRAAVTERVAMRHRGGALGLVLGIALGALILSMSGVSGASVAAPLVLIGGAFSGLAIGVAVTSARASAPLDSTAVKYARTSAVSLRDYVAPLERTGARVVVPLAVIATVAAFMVGAPLSGVLAVLTVLGAASLVFFEVAGRRILNRAQPAASPAELTWDDAVRASVLRDIVTAPISLGAYALVVSASTVVDTVLKGNDLATLGILLAATIPAVTLSIAAVTSRPQRYFLRRLWPAVTA
jgi:hypothetical protein